MVTILGFNTLLISNKADAVYANIKYLRIIRCEILAQIVCLYTVYFQPRHMYPDILNGNFLFPFTSVQQCGALSSSSSRLTV